MKPTKVWLLVAVAVAVAGVTAVRMGSKQEPRPSDFGRAAPIASQTEPVPERGVASPPATPATETVVEAGRPPALSSVSAGDTNLSNRAKSLATGGPATPPQKAREPLKDPLARVALAFVGADPEAEAYWCEAINDPTLSAHERSDLIEDLNEDGLSDPKRPTLEDLPLIENRLRLIQVLAPEAMDQVNFDAFAEAYTDLLNLADVALGGGQPVK